MIIDAELARERLMKISQDKVHIKNRISEGVKKSFKIAWLKEGITSSSQLIEELVEQVNKKYFNSQERLKIPVLAATDRASSSFYISSKSWQTFHQNCKKKGIQIGHMLEYMMFEYIEQIEAKYKIKIQE